MILKYHHPYFLWREDPFEKSVPPVSRKY